MCYASFQGNVMNKYLGEMHKFKGAILATSVNVDLTVERGLVNILIKPNTGTVITTAVAGVKTADLASGLAAATNNVLNNADTVVINSKKSLRIAGAATAAAKIGTALVVYRDRIQPDNAVNHYVA